MITHLLAIFGMALLCAGWIGVQFLAKKMETKNHFDDLNSSCGHCTCGGGAMACEQKDK